MTLDNAQVFIPELLSVHGRFQSHMTAIVCGAHRKSWGDLNRSINRIANRLITSGVARGDRVAVLMNNSIEMVEVLLGVVKAGACVVPLSTMLTPEQIKGLLLDSGPVGLFVSESTYLVAQDPLPSQATLRKDLCVFAGIAGKPIIGFVTLDVWLGAISDDEPKITYRMEDDFNIIYSSGTTGLPKGIVQTHRARQHWAYSNALELRFDNTAIALATTPLYSNGTWFMLLPSLFLGATLVIMEKFTVDGFLSTVARERVTHTFMVPTQIVGLLESAALESADLTSLKTLLSAGSPLRSDIKQRLLNRIGPVLFELYGFSEGFGTIAKPADIARAPDSVGRPVIGFDLRILNEAGEVVSAGQVGEIVGYGAGLMREYFQKPEATAKEIWVDERQRTFFRSGDIGRLDSDGLLYIVDRKKDMILSGGFNVFPGDIEAIVASHEGVLDVAVIGIPHEKWGEVPLALVIHREAKRVDPMAMLQWANQRLSKPQRLARLEFVETFPRNALGKVLKRVLRAQYGAIT